MRALFGQFPKPHQMLLYDALLGHLRQMTMEQLSNTFHGLAQMDLSFDMTPSAFKLEFHSVMQGLFRVEFDDLEREVAQTKFKTRDGNNNLKLDEEWKTRLNDFQKQAMYKETLKEKQVRDDKTRALSSLLHSLGSIGVKFDQLSHDSRISIFNGIFTYRYFENGHFSLMLKGLTKMSVEWSHLNETFRTILLMNMFNENCFSLSKAKYVASSLCSLAEMGMPWYLLPREKWMDFIGTLRGDKMTTQETVELVKGFAKIGKSVACDCVSLTLVVCVKYDEIDKLYVCYFTGTAWHTISVPALRVIDKAIGDDRHHFSEEVRSAKISLFLLLLFLHIISCLHVQYLVLGVYFNSHLHATLTGCFAGAGQADVQRVVDDARLRLLPQEPHPGQGAQASEERTRAQPGAMAAGQGPARGEFEERSGSV